MKKLFILILVLALVYSCSTNTDSNENTSTSINDIDGNVYQTVAICNQTWIQSNLNVSKYRNGDVIPQVTDYAAWSNLTTGAWCYYDNDPANGAVYGRLYNWYAVNDARGLAPAGYHIPSDAEWTILNTCLGGQAFAGGAMKEIGTAHWSTPNTGATNSSGFTALPGGIRGEFNFNSFGGSCYLWSFSQNSTLYVNGKQLDYNKNDVYPYNDYKTSGFSVRCVKD